MVDNNDIHLSQGSDLPFPLEFIIQDTPKSGQIKNANAKEIWKKKIGEAARLRLSELTTWYFLDNRPLAVSIYYFPPVTMLGDIDNIVKPILDGMIHVVYPDDKVIERIVVQKFEPGFTAVFNALTPTLAKAIGAERPVVYIQIAANLAWREVR